MDNETLTRILSARFITCNEQTRKGSKGCTKECKLYELQEPGMTCRDSVLLHAEEAKKILKTAGKDVPSAAITQRKSRIRQGSFLRLSFLFLRLL